MSPRPRRRSRRRRLVALATLCLAVVVAAAVAGTAGHGPVRRGASRSFGSLNPGASSRRAILRRAAGPVRSSPPNAAAPRGLPVTVSIDSGHPAARIPTDFLGLSFEDVALARVARYAHNDEVVQLLRLLGEPGLRFGGVSADARVAFSEGGPLPRWASGEVTPGDLRSLATLADETSASVLLTVGLGHYDPAMAAHEAAAAHALLGARLAGIAIGNEPDRFAIEGLREPTWSFAEYARELGAYRAAIARAAPGVPLAGPDASSGEPVLPWLRAAADLHPNMLTDHYYPLSSCDGSSPTVGELLAPATREGESSMLTSLRAIERAGTAPLRIDETNDISCKGQPGVSDTFASALWASDYIARALTAGIGGLNFHDLLTWPGSYSPLVASAGGLHPNPEWYALLLAQRLRGARPLRATVHGNADMTAWAFLQPGGATQVLLVNFEPPGARPLLVRLALPRPAGRAHEPPSGTILRLSGPSPYATTHVRLGGAEVSATGTWSPRQPLSNVYERTVTPELALAPSSAALVMLAP